MNGTHRSDGLWLVAGGDAAWRRVRPASIESVAPALLGLLGVLPQSTAAPGTPRPYGDDEEARVAARLRALGYLE
jgi:hypothetical protein